MNAASRARGFTLLEVMLAFVVLAVAMGLLVGMLANGLRQVRQAQGETEAALHAQTLLDQIGILEPIAPVVREGNLDQDRYRYRLDISEAEDPVAPVPGQLPPEAGPPVTAASLIGGPTLYRVVLDVSWGAGAPGQQLRFVTLRARLPLPGAVAAK